MKINFAIQDGRRNDTVYLYTDVDVEDTNRCIQIGVCHFVVERAHGKYLTCRALYTNFGEHGNALLAPGGIVYDSNTYRNLYIL